MKKFAQTKEELLLSLINRQTPRAVQGKEINTMCTYSHSINGGCAIGCQVKKSLAKTLDNHGALAFDENDDEGSYSEVFYCLPKRLQKMGHEFLSLIQSTHDEQTNYINSETAEKGKDGLIWNARGKKEINNIISKFDLKIKKL